jgi:hypothetical protein
MVVLGDSICLAATTDKRFDGAESISDDSLSN